MRITFVNPPYAYSPEERHPAGPLPRASPISTFPVGLSILTALARAAGHDVSTVEMPYLTDKETLQSVISARPDVVGISCWTGNQRKLAALCQQIKAQLPKAIIIWGGHHATLFSEQILQNYPVDIVVQGEGEIPFSALLSEFSGGPAATAPGIVRKHGSTVKTTGARQRLRFLDDLPMPAYDLYTLARNDGREEKYGARSFPRTSHRTTLLAARGCPFKCTFCVDGEIFSTTAARGVLQIVDELEYLTKMYNTHLFEFSDMTFTLSQRRTASLCTEIIRRGLKISWQAMSRVNVVSLELLVLMRQAGCYSISFGVETGSEQLLKRLKKQITRREIVLAFAQATAAQLSTNMLLMVGNPGETSDTIQETVDLLYETKPTQIDPSIYQLYPGSATYRALSAQGYIDNDYWLHHDAAPYYTGEHTFSKLRYWQNMLQHHHQNWPRERRFWGLLPSKIGALVSIRGLGSNV